MAIDNSKLLFVRKQLRESGEPHFVQLERELDDSQLLTMIRAFSSARKAHGEEPTKDQVISHLIH